MNKVLCLLLNGMLIGFLTVAPLSAEARIQRYFPQLEEYEFVMESEITPTEDYSRIGPFDFTMLREADLQSFSRWMVTTPSSKTLKLNIYEMQDPTGAFLLFSHWPSLSRKLAAPLDSLAVGNLYGEESSVFWRGHFFFEVVTSGLPQEDFVNLAQGFQAAVSTDNLLPVSVTHLPSDGLIRGSVRYYLGAETLARNERFPEPLLEQIGFADQIEIAYGEYLPDETALFLVGYPTPSLADQYFIDLQKGLQKFFSQDGIYMKRSGVLICLFIGSEQHAMDLLPKVKYAPTIKWLFEKEEPEGAELMTFFGLLTQTILGIGVFLLMIVGAGLAVGLMRYEVLKRFPSLTRSKEPVRLKLK